MIPLAASGAGAPPKARRGSKSAKTAATSSADQGAEQLDLGRGFNLRLPLPELKSLTFLARPVDEPPTLAAVHSDAKGRVLLTTLTVDLAGKDLVTIAETVLEDVGSEICFDVRGQGVIICGEESVRWVPFAPASAGQDKGKARAGVVKCRLPVGMIQA